MLTVRAVAVQEYSLIERHGVCIRVLGDLALLPASVRAAADRVMAATQHHTRGRLNICLSYRWPFAALWPVLHAGDVAEPHAGAVYLGLLSDVMSGINIAGEPNRWNGLRADLLARSQFPPMISRACAGFPNENLRLYKLNSNSKSNQSGEDQLVQDPSASTQFLGCSGSLRDTWESILYFSAPMAAVDCLDQQWAINSRRCVHLSRHSLL